MRFLALSVASLVLVAGCAGSTESTQSGEANISAQHEISQDLLCAAVAAAEQGETGGGLAESDLHGDALADFRSFQENMRDDYPSEAAELPVTLGSHTYTFILVSETNDGGGQMGIYRNDGSTVATESSGRSSPFTWSSPADHCGR